MAGDTSVKCYMSVIQMMVYKYVWSL